MKKLANCASFSSSSYNKQTTHQSRSNEDVRRREGQDETNDVAITKEDVFGDGSTLVLRNFLTPQECQNFVAQAENFGLVDCGYSHRVRKTDRVSAESDEVASWMFDRLLP